MIDVQSRTQTLESLSIEAWPALETRHYDGWVLRFADGYTNRSNSIYPVYASSLPIADKLTYCEAIYRHHHLPVVFRLTENSTPAGLDALLAQRGYQLQESSLVQTADLHPYAPRKTQARHHLALREDWLNAHARMKGISSRDQHLHHLLLSAQRHLTCYASYLDESGRIVAVGLGVLIGEDLGIYDMVVAPELRGRGLGKHIVAALLNWGREHDAERAFLLVSEGNQVARALYADFGFSTQYRYWYRALA